MEFVAGVQVELGELMSVGAVASGERRIVPIVGGRFEGPRLRGSVLAVGADWQVLQHDGAMRIDTRYTWRTDDGALIYVQTRGWRTGPAEVLARLAAGEPVDRSEYYFRVSCELETGVGPHAWVNSTVFVADAARAADRVSYDLWQVC